ncbi:transglutaminase-like domain-containing protein [archaeon]|nr:transglutaminase-like domain-containing protein [archaeon]
MISHTEFYSTHSPMTYLPDTPMIKTLTEDLPETVPKIIETVQNSLIHVYWVERYGEKFKEDHSSVLSTRSAADILRQVYKQDPKNLQEKRKQSEKPIGNCRDFTVLSVAFMRENGIPARARCGFATYFSTPDMKLKYIDHWVVEYWNTDEQRWIMVDSQLDEFQKETLKPGFNTLDMPHDRFITGGVGWQMCREEKADPETFGIFEMNGMGFIRGDMIRDLAALVKTPLLPWDCWGIMLDEDIKDVELMDKVASVTQPATQNYNEIMELSEHPRLKVPEVITSWEGMEEPLKIKLSEVTEKI